MRTKPAVLCLALALAAAAVAVAAVPAPAPAGQNALAPAAAPQPAPATTAGTAPAQLPAFLAAGPVAAPAFTSCCSLAEKQACAHYGLIWSCDTGFCTCTAP